jgi:hypothetical protein
MSKKTGAKPAVSQKSQTPEIVLSRSAFLISTWITILGLVIQYVIAFIVYPKLGATIPSAWVGWVPVGGTIPSWTVFTAFPIAQAVVFLTGFFSPKNDDGKRVMESGRAISLILLAILFTALQASIFRLIR